MAISIAKFVGNLGEQCRRGNAHGGVGGHVVELFGDHDDVMAGLDAEHRLNRFETAHDLQRSNQVQRCQSRIEDEGDRLVVHSATSEGRTVASTSTLRIMDSS